MEPMEVSLKSRIFMKNNGKVTLSRVYHDILKENLDMYKINSKPVIEF